MSPQPSQHSTVKKFNSGCRFTIELSAKRENNEFEYALKVSSIKWHTDGSKTREGTGVESLT